MKRSNLSVIVSAVSDNNLSTVLVELDRIVATESGNWKLYANRLAAYIRANLQGKPAHSIFTIGNDKLPFLAFSALALASCPGSGTCRSFCYSLRAWRYPAAFFRQVQNSLLIANNPDAIRDALSAKLEKTRKFKNAETVDIRLYVDGDINSLETMRFWFQDVLPSFPKLRAYGYSKSFQVFRDYANAGFDWPNNYVLNLSSGSIYDGDAEMRAFMKSLPITRGDFVAVEIAGVWSAAKGDYKTKAYRDAVRASFDGKAFVCPGRCGSCTGAGHACGNPDVSIPIVIGIH
jgi:hypothetical protein